VNEVIRSVAGLLILASSLACHGSPRSLSGAGSDFRSVTTLRSVGLDTAQWRRARQLLAHFENDRPEPQYDYVEVVKEEGIPDGRGYTAGWAGFTTRDGDLLRVVDLYFSFGTATSAGGHLARYRDTLRALATRQTGDTAWLAVNGFSSAWRLAAADSVFRRAQDSLVWMEKYQPAADSAAGRGWREPVSTLYLFDAWVLQGESGVNDLLRRVSARRRGTIRTEVEQRQEFLTQRRRVMCRDHTWRENVWRLSALDTISRIDPQMRSPWTFKITDRCRRRRWQTHGVTVP
jgi:chitosanase